MNRGLRGGEAEEGDVAAASVAFPNVVLLLLFVSPLLVIVYALLMRMMMNVMSILLIADCW